MVVINVVGITFYFKGIEEWKLSDEERLQQAELYKSKGTKYFTKQNFSLAIKMYKSCVDIISKIGKNLI